MIMRWHDGKGVTIEADPRHVDTMIQDNGGKEGMIASTPAVR